MTMMNDPTATCRILLVDPNDGARRTLHLRLTGQGYPVHAFPRSEPALASEAAMRATHLFTVPRLPEESGADLLRQLRSRGWSGTAILLDDGSEPLDHTAMGAAGFARILPRPARDADLLEALRPAGGRNLR